MGKSCVLLYSFPFWAQLSRPVSEVSGSVGGLGKEINRRDRKVLLPRERTGEFETITPISRSPEPLLLATCDDGEDRMWNLQVCITF